MQSQPSTVRLRSGETAVIRDLRSEDAAALYQCFCAFSEASLRVFRSQPFTLAEARMLAAQAGQPGCMRAIGLVGGGGRRLCLAVVGGEHGVVSDA